MKNLIILVAIISFAALIHCDVSVGEVQDCVEENLPQQCQQWNQICFNSQYAMSTCIEDNIFKNCIQGLQKLSYFTREDTYPPEMIKCSYTCNPLSSDTFFTNVYANVYQSCQSSGQPPSVEKNSQFVTKETYIQKRDQCKTYDTPDFQQDMEAFNECQLSYKQCRMANQTFTLSSLTDQVQYSLYSCYQSCKPNEKSTTLEFQQYFNCDIQSLLYTVSSSSKLLLIPLLANLLIIVAIMLNL